MKNFPFSAKKEGHFCPRKFLKGIVSVRLPATLFDFIRLRTRVLTMYIRCLGIKEVGKRLRGRLTYRSLFGREVYLVV